MMSKYRFGNLLFIILLIHFSCTNESSKPASNFIEISNPVLSVDYSDPDVINVNGKYYLTASSFNCIPGLPLLESTDLVHWNLIGYALQKLEPDSVYSKPQHGNGVWAPAIRFHNGQFYIYYSDPDFGIFVVTASKIEGPWSKPYLVQSGKGWIDPCPFWDDNGKAWLVHAWAGSRAGIKSTLILHQMSADGKQLLNNGILVFDGHEENRTVEGPKMYKRNGYYYIFAPAGGVTEGWQLVMRSEDIYGPYENRKVLHQGNTLINGPHQGAWITDHKGNDWFFHFQDKGAFGRIVHLQPMHWVDNWPQIGENIDATGLGEPVHQLKIQANQIPSESFIHSCSDEFNTPFLNLNWQWHANINPKWGSPSANLGFLRLNAWVMPDAKNLWEVPNLLLQKFPAENFSVETKLDLFLKEPGDKTGLLIMGSDYAYVGIERKETANFLVYKTCLGADKGKPEQTMFEIPWEHESVLLKVNVNPEGNCKFSFSSTTANYQSITPEFKAQPGRWIGAKCGLFCTGNIKTNDAGYVNADWFRFLKTK